MFFSHPAPSATWFFRQEVKDKDIEGALQLRNLSVTRWVARSESIVAV
jgi:hypothetical protein